MDCEIVTRPKNGFQCMRNFVNKFMKEEGRLPLLEEAKSHVKGNQFASSYFTKIYNVSCKELTDEIRQKLMWDKFFELFKSEKLFFLNSKRNFYFYFNELEPFGFSYSEFYFIYEILSSHKKTNSSYLKMQFKGIDIVTKYYEEKEVMNSLAL